MKFYSGLLLDAEVVSQTCTIVQIEHSDLGDVNKINTNGLDYNVYLADGRNFKVETEKIQIMFMIFKSNQLIGIFN